MADQILNKRNKTCNVYGVNGLIYFSMEPRHVSSSPKLPLVFQRLDVYTKNIVCCLNRNILFGSVSKEDCLEIQTWVYDRFSYGLDLKFEQFESGLWSTFFGHLFAFDDHSFMATQNQIWVEWLFIWHHFHLVDNDKKKEPNESIHSTRWQMFTCKVTATCQGSERLSSHLTASKNKRIVKALILLFCSGHVILQHDRCNRNWCERTPGFVIGHFLLKIETMV